MCDNVYQDMLNSSNQPGVMFYRRKNCDTDGPYFSRTSTTDIPDLSERTFNNKKFQNNLSSIVVPPNRSVRIYDKVNYEGKYANLDKGPHAKLSNYGLNDDVSSFKIFSRGSWDDHILDCCLQKNNSNDCGDYYTSTSKCSNVMDNYFNKYDLDKLAKKYGQSRFVRWKNKIKDVFMQKLNKDSDAKLRCCQNDSKFNKDLCGNYWGSTHDGSCDSLLIDYCGNNWKNDERCGCLLPRSEYESNVYDMGVECLDGRCTSFPNPYQTYNQRTNPCNLSLVDCRTLLDLAATEGGLANVGDVTIQKKCGQYALEPEPVPEPEPEPVPEPEPIPEPEPVPVSESDYTYWYIGGGLILVVFIFLIALGFVLYYLL